MNLKYLLILLMIMICSSIYSQHSLNDYKYVIVQKQFHFQTEPNQYDLNRIVRYLFEKHGFNVVMEGQPIPKDLRSNFCLALSSDVRTSGLLRTKAYIVFRNCEGKVVFTTEEGVTKEKEHKRAYNIAIHKTFETFNNIDYKFQPKESEAVVETNEEHTTTSEETSKNVKIEGTNLEETNQEVNPKIEEKAVASKPVLDNQESDNQVVNTANSVEDSSDTTEEKSKYVSDPRQLFAQKTANGYELMHNSKLVMTMIETSIKDVYLVKGKDALIYKEEGYWLYSDKSNESSEPVILNLKFFP